MGYVIVIAGAVAATLCRRRLRDGCFPLCCLGWVVAFDNFPHLHRLLDHARVRHLGRDRSLASVSSGLPAYDTQRIRGMYDRSDDASSAGRKAAMGALSLYLDLINQFVLMLRLAGDRR